MALFKLVYFYEISNQFCKIKMYGLRSLFVLKVYCYVIWIEMFSIFIIIVLSILIISFYFLTINTL